MPCVPGLLLLALQELEELRELKADIERKEKQQAAIIDQQVGPAGDLGAGMRGIRGDGACEDGRMGEGRSAWAW